MSGVRTSRPSGDDVLRRVDHDPDVRFSLANERTFLAYIRTALALVAGGVALAHLSRLEDAARLAVAVPPIVGGLVLALAAARRWRAVETALREGRAIPAAFVARLTWGVVGLSAGAAIITIVDVVG